MRRGLWLLIPLLLLALLYASLPALAGLVAVRWLESRGFEQPQLALEYPGFRELRVSLLALGHSDGGRRLELTGAAVEIGYDLPTLIFERRLSWIRIPHIELRITDTAAAAQAAAPLYLAPLLPSAWLSLAPADRIQIGQLRLDYLAPAQPVRRIEGNIDLQNDTLNSRLLLLEDGTARARADLELNAQTFSLSLLQDNLPAYHVSGSLSVEDEQLSLTLEQQLWLARAQRWQRLWLPDLGPVPDLAGVLHGRGQLRLPLTLNLENPLWWRSLVLAQALDGDLVAEAPAPGLERLRLPLRAQLQLEQGRLRFDLPAASEARLEGLTQAGFDPVDAGLKLLSGTRLEADLAALPQSLSLSPLRLELSTGALQQEARTLRLSPLQLQLDHIALDPLLMEGQLRIARTDWLEPGRTFALTDFHAGFGLNLEGARLRLRLAEGSGARLEQLSLEPFSPLAADIRLESATGITADTDDPLTGLQLTPLQLSLTPEPLRHPDGELRLSPLQLRIDSLDPQRPALSGQLKVAQIQWHLPEQPLPTASLSSTFSLDGNSLTGRFELGLDDPDLRIRGRASSTLSPVAGDLFWQATPLPLHRAERLWNLYRPPAPPELGVSGGTLHLEGSVNWTNAGMALRVDHRIEQLAANWESTRVEGGEWRAQTLRYRNGRLQQTGTLRVPLLDIGFPVESIDTGYRLTQSPGQDAELTLDPVRASLLDGELTIDSVTINPLAPTLDTRVTLQHLELARLLELQQQRGLSGSGRLGGTLPIRFDSDGLRIRDGRLQSESPGLLQFRPDTDIAALTGSNPGMTMAMQALQNFHYDLISVGLQYAPDGTTRMATRLRGNNPDWNGGQAVDFNINIEQNVLKLLQTLQFTDQLTESIEKRYR